MTIRNEYFESFGGKLKCEVGYVNVLVLYRFIYNKNIDNLFAHLTALLELINDKPTIIMGDFNFDVLNCDDVTNVQRYIDTFMCTGFIPLIGKPTHFKGSSSTSIHGEIQMLTVIDSNP